MFIQVLGMGCSKCDKLEALARRAAMEMELEFTLEKVSDLQKIMSFGVMTTPALVVDGEVKLSGRIGSLAEVKKILSAE